MFGQKLFVSVLAMLCLLIGCDNTSTLKGRVVDSGGNPIGDALVEFDSPSGGCRSAETTDANGSFEIFYMYAASLWGRGHQGSVKVIKDGYLVGNKTFSPGEQSLVEIILSKVTD